MIAQHAPAVKGSNPIRRNSCDSENPLTKYLILTQQSPKGSPKREKYFERLVYHLMQYLYCKNSHLVSKQDHEEAANDTILAVYNQIDRLTPSHLIPFAKKVLTNKVVDQIRKSPKLPTVSLDQSMSDGETTFLETIAQPEPDPRIVALTDLINNDPDNMLQNSMKGRNLTWQRILQYRLQGYQWNKLTQIFGKTSISSLNSFDKREIKRLTPYLKQALSS